MVEQSIYTQQTVTYETMHRNTTQTHLELDSVSDVCRVHRSHCPLLHLRTWLEVHLKATQQGRGQVGGCGRSVGSLLVGSVLVTLCVLNWVSERVSVSVSDQGLTVTLCKWAALNHRARAVSESTSP